MDRSRIQGLYWRYCHTSSTATSFGWYTQTCFDSHMDLKDPILRHIHSKSRSLLVDHLCLIRIFQFPMISLYPHWWLDTSLQNCVLGIGILEHLILSLDISKNCCSTCLFLGVSLFVCRFHFQNLCVYMSPFRYVKNRLNNLSFCSHKDGIDTHRLECTTFDIPNHCFLFVLNSMYRSICLGVD